MGSAMDLHIRTGFVYTVSYLTSNYACYIPASYQSKQIACLLYTAIIAICQVCYILPSIKAYASGRKKPFPFDHSSQLKFFALLHFDLAII